MRRLIEMSIHGKLYFVLVMFVGINHDLCYSKGAEFTPQTQEEREREREREGERERERCFLRALIID